MVTTHSLVAALCLSLALFNLVRPSSSLPVLSISSTFLNCTTASSTMPSTCTSCPITLYLTYPTPTTNYSCLPVPSFPDFSLYYSYNASTFTQGTLSLYRWINGTAVNATGCIASNLLTSLPIATVIQCNNATSATQTWQFSGGGSGPTTSVLLGNSTSNNTTPFPYAAAAASCNGNCTTPLLCPAPPSSNASMMASTPSYSLTTNVTLTSFCPSTCNPPYLAAVVGWQAQCLTLAGSDPRLQCGCTGAGYIGELMSNCFISDASSQLLLNTAQTVFNNCSQYWVRPSMSSMSSSTGSASSSTGLPASSPVSNVNVGAIVGGVLGGAVGLVVLILILRCCMRLQAKGHNIEIHRRQKSSTELQQQLEAEGRKMQAERDGLTAGDDEDDDMDGDGDGGEEDDEDDVGDGEEMDEDDIEEQKLPPPSTVAVPAKP